MLGINFVSPWQLRGMVETADWGSRDFAVVDLRDSDFVGGHIPGCDHIPSQSFISTLDSVISRLQGKRLVIFHCLISKHRAPMCAKIYKERLMAFGRSQEVAVLEGGFHTWREHFSGNPRLIEGETLSHADAQHQLQQGFGLGEQFVANVRGSMPQGPSAFSNVTQLQSTSDPSAFSNVTRLQSTSDPSAFRMEPQLAPLLPHGTTIPISPRGFQAETIPYSNFMRYDAPTLPVANGFQYGCAVQYGSAVQSVVRPLSGDRIFTNPIASF
jgi:Cdc25 family phosphatase